MTRQEYYESRQAPAIAREKQIIKYLKQGKTRNEIADILGVVPCQVTNLHTRYIQTRPNRDPDDIYSNLTIKTCIPLRAKGLTTRQDIIHFIVEVNHECWPEALRTIPNISYKGASEIIDWLTDLALYEALR